MKRTMGSGFSIKAKGRSEADIYIYEDVGSDFCNGVSAKQFSEDLVAIGSVSLINLHIASLGGDVNEGLAIYRRLIEHPARIVTYVDSWAASIAATIAMAGDEIRIAEAGAIMIHNAWGMAFGDADAFRATADRLDAVTGSLADVFVGRTGADLAQVRAWMTAETWFYGQEAVDAGFADSVMPNMRIAAQYRPDMHKFRNAPASLQATPNRDAMKQRLAQMKAKMQRRAIAA